MTRRLLASYLTITVIVLVLLMVPLAAFYSQRERERLASDVEHDANVIATLYEDDLEAGDPLNPVPADTYEDRTGARVVVVDRAGISQVDTGDAVDRDFSTRPGSRPRSRVFERRGRAAPTPSERICSTSRCPSRPAGPCTARCGSHSTRVTSTRGFEPSGSHWAASQ